MHKASAHHLQIDAQTVPEQQQPPLPNSPLFSLFCHMLPCSVGDPFGQFRSVCPGSAPSQQLVPPSPTAGRIVLETEKLSLAMCSTAQ